MLFLWSIYHVEAVDHGTHFVKQATSVIAYVMTSPSTSPGPQAEIHHLICISHFQVKAKPYYLVI